MQEEPFNSISDRSPPELSCQFATLSLHKNAHSHGDFLGFKPSRFIKELPAWDLNANLWVISKDKLHNIPLSNTLCLLLFSLLPQAASLLGQKKKLMMHMSLCFIFICTRLPKTPMCFFSLSIGPLSGQIQDAQPYAPSRFGECCCEGKVVAELCPIPGESPFVEILASLDIIASLVP